MSNIYIPKVGDLIRFYCNGIGGFLFGVIIKYKDNFHSGELNIWRKKNIYFLEEHTIELINNIEDVKDYELDDFQEFLNEIKNNNVFCKYIMR